MNAHAIDFEATAPRLRQVQQQVLLVKFKSVAGLRWAAVGGGATVAEAIESAREGLPGGTWIAVSWDDLYGE
jgi:hypothetical protein